MSAPLKLEHDDSGIKVMIFEFPRFFIFHLCFALAHQELLVGVTPTAILHQFCYVSISRTLLFQTENPYGINKSTASVHHGGESKL